MAQVNSANMGFRVEGTRSYQDKLKLKHTQVDLPYHGGCERRLNAGQGLEQPKSLGKHDQKKIKDDELVKHMSNLPGYLQRVDRRVNLQDNPLNVGVLEWGRLEKWKHNQRHLPTRVSKDASSNSINSSLKMTSGSSAISLGDHNKHGEKDYSISSIIDSSPNKKLPEVAKHSIRKATHHQHSETTSQSMFDESKKTRRTYKSSGKTNEDVMLEKIKKRDLAKKVSSDRRSLSSSTRNYKHPPSSEKITSHLNAKAKMRVKDLKEADIKIRHSDQEIASELEDSLSKLKTNAVSVCSEGKASAGGGEDKNRVADLEKSNIDLDHQQCPGEHRDIVLLLPKKLPKRNFSSACQLSETRTSCEENLLKENWSSCSRHFAPEEVHYAELSSEIPHSCPLPSRVENNNETDRMPHSMLNGHGLKLSYDESQMPSSSSKTEGILFEDRYVEINKLNINPTNQKSVESLKILDDHTADLAATKGRDSPNRRFSFSRMSRSFSLKEGSGVPQFSSTYVSVKSGPVRSEDSVCLDNSNRGKADNVHNRARSSPLRRLLDPLLKSKATNSPHSSETVQPVERNLNSLKSINPSESFQYEKYASSQVQAILQLTVKNGLPLFKFVVDNNRNILAATMKNSDTCKKGVSSQNFTFYSVKENKKKSGGWMSQGNKSKTCGYVYNIVGQMNVSSSLTGENSIRESVLYGVEISQEGQESMSYPQHRELAAVVVKNPFGNLSDKDNKDPDSTIIILPGGVHGLPNKGIPSALIDRWKSGGSCDCGGWDVGCKLRLLCNGSHCFTNPGTSKPPLIPDHLQLYVQDEAQQNKPMFSLASLKNGIYSIEFNASISLLQAFFICIAVTNCQNLNNLSETSNLSEAKILQEPTLNVNDGLKTTPAILPGGISVLNPPNSPVGRV